MNHKVVPSDAEIAQKAIQKPIIEIAKIIGLKEEDLILYGENKAKIRMSKINQIFNSQKRRGKLILVSAITPTPMGEGKTTVTIGLTQALRKIDKNAIAALREPSLGPCFGVKGGAAGGGYSQVLPMEEINLHFTGDLHAVGVAHNLIAAMLDNHLYYRKNRKLSLRELSWKRVMDMNDRSLREIIVGLGKNGVIRDTGFDITAASEIMAILCLSRSYSEMKEKIGKILIGLDLENMSPFYAKELKAQGATAALLKEALLPNLVQTLEHGPVLIHGGPFANIAQGANSILATDLALHLADYTVTEAGFGFDLGGEKFFNIVSKYGGFSPDAVVLVATVRALKHHGGAHKDDLKNENLKALRDGFCNLQKHIENAKNFGRNPIIAINRFPTDTENEMKLLQEMCQEMGVVSHITDIWAKGGEGGIELAKSVAKSVSEEVSPIHYTYDWNETPEQKIEKIATQIYGAKDVYYFPKAKKDLELITNHQLGKLPICMAKTQSSFSDDPKLRGRPENFTLSVREIVVSSGAGFIVPITGEIMRMPGLPKIASAEQIDIDDNGVIHGLF